MAKAGYYGGDPDAVLRAPVDTVLGIMNYEGFTSDYDRAYIDLNKSGVES